jgi:AraC-like DNA-binding protein
MMQNAIMERPRREIILPAAGASYWRSLEKPSHGLLYLGWGWRRYGKNPIPPRLHDGWTYTVITAGNPILQAGESRKRLSTGTLVLAGPDVPFGWLGEGSSRSSILAWVWTRAPAFHATEITPRTCWIRNTAPETLERLKRLHEETRQEAHAADSHSSKLLGTVQIRLNAEFERAAGRVRGGPDINTQKIHLALEWMRRHLDARSPTAGLADYLGVSPITLQRLFLKQTGVPPARMFLDLKMQEAAALLAKEAATVKEVAFTMGYKNSCDFTRAFTRFHERNPSEYTRERSP